MEDGAWAKPGLTKLKSVNLNFITQINPGSIYAILRTAKDLENLEIAGCELLLENDVEKVLADGKKLEYLNFNHIPAVTA